MSAPKSALTLLAGLFLFSSWSLPALRWAAFQPAAASRARLSPKEKLELSRRLSVMVQDPAAITKDDLKAAKKSLSADDVKMLSLLRQASR